MGKSTGSGVLGPGKEDEHNCIGRFLNLYSKVQLGEKGALACLDGQSSQESMKALTASIKGQGCGNPGQDYKAWMR